MSYRELIKKFTEERYMYPPNRTDPCYPNLDSNPAYFFNQSQYQPPRQPIVPNVCGYVPVNPNKPTKPCATSCNSYLCQCKKSKCKDQKKQCRSKSCSTCKPCKPCKMVKGKNPDNVILPVQQVPVPVIYEPANPCYQPWAAYPWIFNSWVEHVDF